MSSDGTYPAWSIEFAPGVAAMTYPDPGDWVDVSEFVSRWELKWGRESEFDQPGAGTATVELDNSTGTWDPDNASGDYFGDLKAGAWFRIKAGETAPDNDVFYGHVSIDGFPVSASQFPDSTVTVQLVDDLEWLANVDLTSVYYQEVMADAPVAWYRLGEASGSVGRDSSGNEQHGTYEGGATFYSRSSLVAGDGDSAIEFATDETKLDVPPTLITAYPFTVEAWFSSDEVGTLNQFMYQSEGAFVGFVGDAIAVTIGGTSGPPDTIGEAYIDVANTDGTERMVSTGVRVDDGSPHHLVAVANSASDFEVWLDGVDVTTVELVGSPTIEAYAVSTVGNTGETAPGTIPAPFLAILDEVAIYDTALSSVRIAAHYAAGSAPWAGDNTGTRVGKLLDMIGFHSQRNIDTGQSTMQAATLGTDALTALMDAAKAEGGLLYVDHQDGGKLRFLDRHERLTASASITSQATFGDSGAEITYDAVTLADDRIVNVASVQRANGATVTIDESSGSDYGRRSYSESGLLYEDDAESQSRAQRIVAEKQDRHRVPKSVTLRPRKSTHAAWSHVFARKLDDRVTVKWRPPYGGTYTFHAWVDGIAHSWSKSDGLSATLYLAPVPYDATAEPYFIVGTSTIDGPARIGY